MSGTAVNTVLPCFTSPINFVENENFSAAPAAPAAGCGAALADADAPAAAAEAAGNFGLKLLAFC